MTPANICVTGGAGFIGSHVIEALLVAYPDAKIVVLDNFDDFYARQEKINALDRADPGHRLTVINCDINEPRLIELFRKMRFDTVIHLAARPGVQPSIANPQRAYWVNVHGTANVLRACKDTGVPRIVLASSSSVYGNMRGPWSEHDSVSPLSPYALSKVMTEQLGMLHARETSATVTALRFFTVYGPGIRPDLAIRIFTEQILRGQELTVYGPGLSRDFTYVADVAKAVCMALEAPLVGYDVFNIGGELPIDIMEVIRYLEEITGINAKVTVAGTRLADPKCTYANATKAFRAFRWLASTPLSVGLAHTVAWMKERVL